jgi:hypothetical protein
MMCRRITISIHQIYREGVLRSLAWEKSRRKFVQGYGHDFRCETEGIFYTYQRKKNVRKITSYTKLPFSTPECLESSCGKKGT